MAGGTSQRSPPRRPPLPGRRRRPLPLHGVVPHGRAGLSRRPSLRPCRLAVACRVLPPLTPRSARGADRPPRAAWRSAGARPLRGGPGRQGARSRSTRAPRRAQLLSSCLLLLLLPVVFVSGSCFRLLLSVVLRVGVVLLLVCHADSLFLPLFLSSVVSCACVLWVSAAVPFFCSCAGAGRPSGGCRHCVH